MSGYSVIGYQPGNSIVHQLSAVSKLLFFILVSITAMVTYDTRLILVIALFSLSLFRLSGISLKSVSFVFGLAAVFALLNAAMVYVFSPEYGVELYGARTVWFAGVGSYTITAQELFYLLNLLLKYVCTIPLGVIFLMTTHPSQIAASLHQIGISYKVAYAVSLTMRYIPDVQEEYHLIRLSQEARGLELSQKAPLVERIKGYLTLVTPLIFGALERIETISTAMELRRFGKEKTRTWYVAQALSGLDYLVIGLAFLLFSLMLSLFFFNQGRFYNPWT